MQTLNIIIFCIFFLNSSLQHSQFPTNFPKNDSDIGNALDRSKISDFEIGPSEQRISLSVGGNVIFKVGDLDGSSNVRLEYKPIAFGSFITIPGFGSITSTGIYQKSMIEIQTLFGLGLFVWRATDNDNPNHFSQNNLLIVIL